MSYCRWSSMNWMCDLYCYEDVSGGWTTHVAGSRRVREPVPNDDKTFLDFMNKKISAEEFTARHRQTMADLDYIPLEPIGLPHDGESFNDRTLEEFRDRVQGLRDAGYLVPDYVFEAIEEEMKEAPSATG